VSPPRWSVVIPAFNEALRLTRYPEEVADFFAGRGEPYEVLVVDDGSTDRTAGVVEAAARAHRTVRLFRSEGNRGKGATVRQGMLAARGALRLLTDADGATPIAEVERLENALVSGADIAIGSRWLPHRGVSVNARRHRVAAGRLFNWIVARLGLGVIADSQCGFNAVTAAAARDLFPRLQTAGFGFDVELLLLSRAHGYRIVEVPVNWTDQAGSKTGVLKSGPRMLCEIVLTRLRIGRAA
jgi:dolichyl-phosphate beta-glucosyltransferase